MHRDLTEKNTCFAVFVRYACGATQSYTLAECVDKRFLKLTFKT